MIESGIVSFPTAWEVLFYEQSLIKTLNQRLTRALPTSVLISICVYVLRFPLRLYKTRFCPGCIALLPHKHTHKRSSPFCQPARALPTQFSFLRELTQSFVLAMVLV